MCRVVTVLRVPLMSLNADEGAVRLREVVALVILRQDRQWHVVV